MNERPRAAADEDAACIARVVRGDADAFRALVVRYQGPLFCVLRDLLPGEADREDVAQDAFVAAWRSLAEWDGARGAFFTWLVRIARNRALNVRKRRTPSAPGQLPERGADAPVDDGLLRREIRERLDAALAGLPEDQRTAFTLAEIHEIPLADVAAVTDAPVGTVKSRVARAREKLRAALAPLEVKP